MKYAIPNRGPVWMQLATPDDKQAMLEALSQVGRLPKTLATFRELLKSHIELESALDAPKGRYQESPNDGSEEAGTYRRDETGDGRTRSRGAAVRYAS